MSDPPMAACSKASAATCNNNNCIELELNWNEKIVELLKYEKIESDMFHCVWKLVIFYASYMFS